MMHYLRQSTATTVRLGPFVDDTDGKTPETGLTIVQADIRLTKAGGDFAQSNDSGGGTHDEDGWYSLQLDATDTATLGRLLVAIDVAGALPVWREFMVVTANVFDTLCSTDALEVDADAIWSATPRTLTHIAVGTSSGAIGDDIEIKRGDTLSLPITGLGDISTRTKLWFTVKESYGDTDAESIIQIEEGAGLVYLNAAAASEATDGSITVDDENAGDITILLKVAATALLEVQNLWYDIQWLDGSDVVVTPVAAQCDIVSDITRAIA